MTLTWRCKKITRLLKRNIAQRLLIRFSSKLTLHNLSKQYKFSSNEQKKNVFIKQDWLKQQEFIILVPDRFWHVKNKHYFFLFSFLFLSQSCFIKASFDSPNKFSWREKNSAWFLFAVLLSKLVLLQPKWFTSEAAFNHSSGVYSRTQTRHKKI